MNDKISGLLVSGNRSRRRRLASPKSVQVVLPNDVLYLKRELSCEEVQSLKSHDKFFRPVVTVTLYTHLILSPQPTSISMSKYDDILSSMLTEEPKWSIEDEQVTP